jgi:hypothetical protein
MPPSCTFTVSYNREKQVMRTSWHDSDPFIFVCPNNSEDISKAILNNLTQQWDAATMASLGLSNLLQKDKLAIVEELGNRLPATNDFAFSCEQLLEILHVL